MIIEIKEVKMKKRLDLILVEKGFFETREKAKREIMVGNVSVNDKVETKAGTNFRDDDKLQIKVKDKLKYVSRGGLKLEKALQHWEIDLNGKRVLDIGASTGGFTDCALQNGAEYVYGVDVGTNQLDWRLRQDTRVKSLEETHIKDLTLDQLDGKKVDFIVIDVSFISLTKVIPYLERFIAEGSRALMLIKPQFEVGREKIGRNGIVIEESSSLSVWMTRMSLIAMGSTVSGLLSKITRSANFPGSSEPLVACSPCCSAAHSVMALRPSSAVMRWSGPMGTPSREIRLTADHSINIWSSGATTASVWLVGRKPASIASRMGLMYMACALPRLLMCAWAK